MSAIRTNAAAGMLGVSPNTLRGWERRFGYPTPRRTEGGHRQFELAEIEALRQAFCETPDIAAAVSIARERGQGPSSPARLHAALAEFREQAADRLLEESLAVRSVERTVESVLLPGLEPLEIGTPERAFAWRYASGWLAAQTRVAPPASLKEGALILDACPHASVDALRVQALELSLRRGGLRVLTLPVDLDAARLGAALRALRPGAVVLAGTGARAELLARLVYAARQAEPGVAVLDYLHALPDTGASTVERLDPSPALAARQLRERLTGIAVRDAACAS
jgi:MerR family transcriptional regulator, light-induced transcriptional regulator